MTTHTAADTLASVAEQARCMHSAGHGLHDIASALRIHPEQVRRWLTALDHSEAAVVHARTWSGEAALWPRSSRNVA